MMINNGKCLCSYLLKVILVLLLTGILFYCAGPVLAGTSSMPTYILQWGSSGSTDGKFAAPQGVAVNMNDGNVYVADYGNNRIQKFDSNGGFLGKWAPSGSDNFTQPRSLAVDSSNNVYVADTGNHRIQKRDSNGGFLTRWGHNGGDGTSGSDNGSFNAPSGICVAPDGSVYVADQLNDRIQKFNSSGSFVTSWGGHTGTLEDGKFDHPYDVAVDPSGNNIYVSDYQNHRIQKFTSAGVYQAKWDTGLNWNPVGISVDSSNYVYVSFSGTINEVGKYDSTGNLIGLIEGLAGFNRPEDVAVGRSPTLYISERGNNLINKFTLTPSAPTLVSPADNATVRGQSGTFTWAAVWGSPTGYWLRVSSTNMNTDYYYGDVGAVTSKSVTTLPGNGSTLYWNVMAYNSYGFGPQSAWRSFTNTTKRTMCDYNGDGISEIGTYQAGAWYLDYNGNGIWNGTGAGGDKLYTFGNSTMKPVTGDWNSDNKTEIGAFLNGTWYIDYNGNGVWNGTGGGDKLYTFGNASMKPVSGDWNSDNKTEIGAYLNGTWYLDYNGNGVWNGTGAGGDKLYTFGNSSMKPVTGNWNGDGKTEIGAFYNGTWYLDYNGNGVWNGTAGGDRQYSFGNSTMKPVSGDWNADGITEIGAFLNGTWYLDYNGNGAWNGNGTGPTNDRQRTFGNSSMIPVGGAAY